MLKKLNKCINFLFLSNYFLYLLNNYFYDGQFCLTGTMTIL